MTDDALTGLAHDLATRVTGGILSLSDARELQSRRLTAARSPQDLTPAERSSLRALHDAIVGSWVRGTIDGAELRRRWHSRLPWEVGPDGVPVALADAEWRRRLALPGTSDPAALRGVQDASQCPDADLPARYAAAAAWIAAHGSPALRSALAAHAAVWEPDPGPQPCVQARRRRELLTAAVAEGFRTPQAAPKQAAKRVGGPMLSIVINTYNEGQRLIRTIEAYRRDLLATGQPYEIVVVADGTTDGSVDTLGDDVIVVRPGSERVGCGRAKVAGAAAAQGDVLMFCDGHHTVERGHISDLVSRTGTGCIVCPALANIRYTRDWRPERATASEFVPQSNFLVADGDHYGHLRSGDMQDRYCDMVAGVTVMSRQTYERLGGWHGYPGLWGSQERGMALRAWFARVPILVVPSVMLGHEYRRSWTYEAPSYAEVEANLWHAWHVCVGPSEFRQHVAPGLRRRQRYSPNVERIHAADSTLASETERYQTQCRKRPLDAAARKFLRLDTSMPSARPATTETPESFAQWLSGGPRRWSRWGDGEMQAMVGVEGGNVDGVRYTSELRNALLAAWHSRNGVRRAVSGHALAVAGAGTLIGQGRPHRWDWLPGANRAGTLRPLVDALRVMDTLYVGPAFLMPVVRAIWPTGRFVAIPEATAFAERRQIMEAIMAQVAWRKPELIAFSAGPTACVLIEELASRTAAHLLDLGSIWDAYAGRRSRRVLWDTKADPAALWDRNVGGALPSPLVPGSAGALTREQYETACAADPQYLGDRWRYIQAAGLFLDAAVGAPAMPILEIGPRRCPLVPRATLMDAHDFGVGAVIHDATAAPWPWPDRQFAAVVATQVWEHLQGGQEPAWQEACRVADHVILSVPWKWKSPADHAGIDAARLSEWTGRAVPLGCRLVGTRMVLWYRARKRECGDA